MIRHLFLTVTMLLCCSLEASEFPSFPSAWSKLNAKAEGDILIFENSNTAGTLNSVQLDINKVKGRTLIVEAELRGENISRPLAAWNGAKLMLTVQTPFTTIYPRVQGLESGTFGWTKVSVSAPVPLNASNVSISIGLEKSSGKFEVRNLKIRTEEAASLDIRQYANMAYEDEVEGDGKGGWSDQGPQNDASKFDRSNLFFHGVPFFLSRDSGNAVMAFKSNHLQNGIKNQEIDLTGISGGMKYLYVLHTLCWGGGKSDIAGFIDVLYSGNKMQTFEVKNTIDANDWQRPKFLPNGAIAAQWKTGQGKKVAIFLSSFKLETAYGNPIKLVFRSVESEPLWLVSGISLSPIEYKIEMPQEYIVKENQEWKALRRPELTGIKSGTALDRSLILLPEPAGMHGHVIINENGNLAFQDAPSVPVRFLSGCDGSDAWQGRGEVAESQLDSKDKIERYVRQMRLQGYNMTRSHFLDAFLCEDSGKNDIIDPKKLDLFFYYVSKLKENGIYLNFDAMTSWIGYSKGKRWAPENLKDGAFKYKIHFDKEVFDNWIYGVSTLLASVNPYTGTRLADDPVLAVCVGFNEQEFGLARRDDYTELNSLWRDFLKKRYNDNFYLLKSEWGTLSSGESSFDSIASLTGAVVNAGDKRGNDAVRFLSELEKNTYRKFHDELRKLGFKGPISNYNCMKSLRYSIVRNEMDMVTMNTYYAHPDAYTRYGSACSQSSSISEKASPFRQSAGTRLYLHPFGITEHAHAFWNPYRYEQSFVVDAYAAFQGFDLLTFFAHPVSITPAARIHPFTGMHDPVVYSQEFLSFFLFRRGDIRRASSGISVKVKPEDVFSDIRNRGDLPERFTSLALVSGFAVDAGEDSAKLRNGDISFSLCGDESTAAMLDGLRKKGLIPQANRTNLEKNIYESSTGEILLDSGKGNMMISTKRFQGVCSAFDRRFDFPAMSVLRMSVPANISLVSIDGLKNISESSRLVLVCATDALNSNMKFEDSSKTVLHDIGGNPTLVRTGQFDIEIRSEKASSAKVYPLRIDGTRCEPIHVNVKGDLIQLHLDTAVLPEGPSFFFEIDMRS